MSKEGNCFCFNDNIVQSLLSEQDMVAKFEEVEVSLSWRLSLVGPDAFDCLNDEVERGEGPVELMYYRIQLIY